MLLKNGEKYDLTKKDKEELRKIYPSSKYMLIYPPERVKKNPEPENVLPDKPSSISFPLTAKKVVDGETQIWTWCERSFRDDKGNPNYIPRSFSFEGKKLISDIELLYWFHYCCPSLKGGKNFNNRIAKCMIENLQAEATKKANSRREDAKIASLLYNEDIGLSDDEILQAAAAYWISTEDLHIDQVKILLEEAIKKKKNGLEEFEALMKTDQVLKVRSMLQKAIELRLIFYHIPSRTWSWRTEGNKKNIPIEKVPPGMDEHVFLYEHYMNNGNFAKEIAVLLEQNSIVVE